MNRFRKNALLALMLLVTLLTALSLGISLYVAEVQDRSADAMLSAYVSDLSETFAEAPRPLPPPLPRAGRDRNAEGVHHMPRRRPYFRMFTADPSLRSGGLLLLDKDRKPIGGSEGAEELAPLWREGLPLGEVARVSGPGGRTYQMVVRRLDSGNYVLVAASRDNLLARISRLWSYWLFSVIVASTAVLIGIIALWRYFVLPVRRIVEEIDGVRWGTDKPCLQASPLYEVRELEGAIERSAEAAVEKESLRMRYIGDIVRVQEEARKLLARELHDGPLQSVVAAIKRVQLAQKEATGAVRERLDEAERISQHAANEIRDYCDELSPSWLALGIESAMEELAERLSATHGVEIRLSVEGAFESLSDECALSLVRILQEAVSNAVRHGSATVIDVSLRRDDGVVRFEVADNGTGTPDVGEFDYERMRLEGHRGLSNMHERVQLFGGDLRVGPAAGGGWQISVAVPC